MRGAGNTDGGHRPPFCFARRLPAPAIAAGSGGCINGAPRPLPGVQMPLDRLLALAVAALLVPAFPGPASAKPGKLSGSYAVASETPVDPPPGEPKRTHFRIFLTGDSAKSLYGAMDATPQADECLADGSVTKFIGGTACTRHTGGSEFSCSLAIDIKTQRVESAHAC